MAKVTADNGPIPDRARPPASTNTGPLFVNMPVQVGETEYHQAPVDNETTIENQVDKMKAKVDRPTSPASTTNPRSTSATLPNVASDLGTHDQAELTAVHEEHGASPTPWSTSATLPVSPEGDHEDEAPAEEATTAAPVEEKKKFSKAQYGVAFKHFIRIFRTQLGAISYFYLLLALHPSAQGSRSCS
jgi:hypothetical protein